MAASIPTVPAAGGGSVRAVCKEEGEAVPMLVDADTIVVGADTYRRMTQVETFCAAGGFNIADVTAEANAWLSSNCTSIVVRSVTPAHLPAADIHRSPVFTLTVVYEAWVLVGRKRSKTKVLYLACVRDAEKWAATKDAEPSAAKDACGAMKSTTGASPALAPSAPLAASDPAAVV